MNRNKKKLLFIITHLELGGAQKHLLDLVKGLDPGLYSLHLCTGDSGYLRQEFLKVPHLKLIFMPSLVRQVRPLSDVVTFFKLFLFMKKNKFDIVHTHSPKASLLGRWAAFFAGVPTIVYTVHGWSFHRFMNPFSFCLYLALEKITARITDKIIVISRHDLDAGVKRRVADKDKFSLVHCGVDVERFSRVFNERNNGAVDSKLIITVSSLKSQKGLVYFLKMASSLLEQAPDLKFVVVGDGPDRKEVIGQLNALGLEKRVHLAGWVDDVSALMSKSAVLVLSSLWEGLPLSVIEAAIAGIPMVVTDTGGLRDVVSDHRNGIIVEIKDVKGLAASVAGILGGYEDWIRRINKYREELDVAYWSGQRAAKEIDGIYQMS